MINKSADGLRGIASLNVALGHFVGAFLPSLLYSSYPNVFQPNPNPSALFNFFHLPIFTIFFNGHFAVLIFFVLSGYVLSLPHFEDQNNGVLKLKRRLWGRFIRLNLPICAAVIISFSFYYSHFYFNKSAGDLSGSTGWLASYFYPNISIVTALREATYSSILFGNNAFIPPLWTLKIEFIGSLYLLLFYIVKPKNQNLLPVSIALAAIFLYHQLDSIYYLAIFSGSLINRIYLKPALRGLFFITGFYFGAFQYQSHWFEFLPSFSRWISDPAIDKTTYNAIGAFLMTTAVINGFGRRFFEMSFIQFLGKISFPLYLIHFVVLCSITCWLYLFFPHNKAFIILNLLLYLLICFIFASIFEKFIDKPSIKLSHKFSRYLFPKGDKPFNK
jgi:peptidoglycan/LPS O-acetylase OafA/YrhL